MKQITLATLGEATEQEVFDQVAHHLLKQAKRSKNELCMYRGPNGLKCAAGCLISDEEYTPRMDDIAEPTTTDDGDIVNSSTDTTWGGLLEDGIVPEFHGELIVDLQTVHDIRLDWSEELKSLAARRGLDSSVVDQYPEIVVKYSLDH